MWRVQEQKRHTRIAVKDKHFDKITEFKSKDKANHYYFSVFNDNYFTSLQELINGKWENRASSCISALAK